MTKPDDKLEPCPFCGGEASMSEDGDHLGGVYVMVRCKECHSEGPAVRVNDRTARPTPEESAAEGWNTRSPTDFAREDMREMTKPDDKLVCGLGKLRKYSWTGRWAKETILMSDNLVERLRGATRGLCSEDAAGYLPRGVSAADCIEAADYIEQLEREVARKDEALSDGVATLAAVRATSRSGEWSAAASHFHDVCGETIVRLNAALQQKNDE